MDSPSWLVVGGAIVLLGVGFVLVPVVVEPTPAYAQYQLDIQVTSNVPSDADAIKYEQLPQEAQSTFDEARTGETVTLTRAQHESVIEAFRTYSYVQYHDQSYRVSMVHHDGADPSTQALLLIGGVLTTLGGALVAYGGLVAWRKEFHALTPRYSLLLPIGSIMAFYLSPASITGEFLSFTPNQALPLIGFPAVALMIPGTLYARGRVREAISVCLGGLILLAMGLLSTGTPLVAAIAILLFVIIIGGTFGAIPFALGARLTEGGDLPAYEY